MSEAKKPSNSQYNKGWARGVSKGKFDGISACHKALKEAGVDTSALPKIPKLVTTISPEEQKARVEKKREELKKAEARLAALEAKEASGDIEDEEESEEENEEEGEEENEKESEEDEEYEEEDEVE